VFKDEDTHIYINYLLISLLSAFCSPCPNSYHNCNRVINQLSYPHNIMAFHSQTIGLSYHPIHPQFFADALFL